MQYIEIEKDRIPYTFEITLGIEVFVFDVLYNEREELFTVNLYDRDRNPLAYGEPLIYGEVLFDAIRDLDFPIVEIKPIDESGKEKEITYANMNEKVLLAVDYHGE
jgi:hypothetical protein